MNDASCIVEVSSTSKWFGHTKALDKVNLAIPAGRIIGLLGANGAGKSTLLRTIIGLYLPDHGRVVTFGTVARDLGPKELARIGYIHQEGELLNWRTVGQLIRYVSAYYPNWNDGLEQRYVADFEINTDARVGSLSPGERQKVAILIAIGFEPELLVRRHLVVILAARADVPAVVPGQLHGGLGAIRVRDPDGHRAVQGHRRGRLDHDRHRRPHAHDRRRSNPDEPMPPRRAVFPMFSISWSAVTVPLRGRWPAPDAYARVRCDNRAAEARDGDGAGLGGLQRSAAHRLDALEPGCLRAPGELAAQSGERLAARSGGRHPRPRCGSSCWHRCEPLRLASQTQDTVGALAT
ncbi:MAG: ATP-binding cassette domain-containing protein [Phycisphaerae bacterium]|nr:ATP-binding cassette domain-containing protein [Phycisphaerae bacterium]